MSVRSELYDRHEERIPEQYLRNQSRESTRERETSQYLYEGYRDERIRQLQKSRSDILVC
jgi:hypothetical protein